MGAAAFAPALEATRAEAAESTLAFTELKRVRDTADHWADDYERQILIRWGDALFADSPEFDVTKLNGKAAERQFGYNNDFTQFLPLPWGEKSSDHGLMVVQATKPAILANCRPLSLHVLK
ncbi:alkaline phosphatase PhoX [Rhizobium sp. BK377]|uniref:alkaline phosphatase PhoX n=1 Tax=Rhizobium sp. BK377 TaxID=2587058 RepID=UPI0017B396D6|nr:alkaline phosphatase PhoX [Rhizobium sp. BK377]MBB3462174.1 secreted PhoX family phosphatase [Rhizobium sp. BK377]